MRRHEMKMLNESVETNLVINQNTSNERDEMKWDGGFKFDLFMWFCDLCTGIDVGLAGSVFSASCATSALAGSISGGCVARQ